MMKVLIVDDDKSTLVMLRLLLSQAGCQITGVPDASQALEALRAANFEWLIADGQILPINGFELAAKAKEIQPNIRIVMISGIYEPADIAGGPIGKLFQKPVDTDALISYLHGG